MLCVCEWVKGKSVACAQKCAMHFPCRDKDCENIRKARSPLDSYGFSYIPRERKREGRGSGSKWDSQSDGLQSGFELFKKCDCYLQNVQWIETQREARQGERKARGGAMKTSDDDEGNSSCDSRRKIMFYLWVAQLPLLLMLLSLLPRFQHALLFFPFAVRPLCWAQLKIGLNDNSQFAIFCKFSTAECVIYAADIADFFWHNRMCV